MPRYRIHRIRESMKEQFRWLAHTGGTATVKPKDYEVGGESEAATPYALWMSPKADGNALCHGDVYRNCKGRRDTRRLAFSNTSVSNQPNGGFPNQNQTSKTSSMGCPSQQLRPPLNRSPAKRSPVRFKPMPTKPSDPPERGSFALVIYSRNLWDHFFGLYVAPCRVTKSTGPHYTFASSPVAFLTRSRFSRGPNSSQRLPSVFRSVVRRQSFPRNQHFVP